MAAMATPTRAAVDFFQYLDWNYFFNVDWSSSSTLANHLNYSTWSVFEHPRGVAPKYIDMDITTDFPGPGRGNCFELATLRGPSNNDADTEIHVLKDDGKWARLSDDTPGSHLSKARILLSDNIFTTQTPPPGTGQSPTKIRISAYDTGHNSEDFAVGLTYVGNLSEAQCTGDVSKAAVYIDRHEGIRIIRAI
ncbi:MAG TPA: hypothetical protein VJ385_08635 [Fibrobacteria bacterium]|nr:hypothetical protein [Fibrobacteria bacterium]